MSIKITKKETIEEINKKQIFIIGFIDDEKCKLEKLERILLDVLFCNCKKSTEEDLENLLTSVTQLYTGYNIEIKENE